MVRERKYTENDLNNALVEIRRTKNVSLSVIAAKYRIPVATLYFKTHRKFNLCIIIIILLSIFQ